MRIAIFLFLTLLGAAAKEPKPCVLCEIIAGPRQQEGIVYRDDRVMAFLSIGPRNCSAVARWAGFGTTA